MQGFEGETQCQVAISLIVGIDSVANLTTPIGTEATNFKELRTID